MVLATCLANNEREYGTLKESGTREDHTDSVTAISVRTELEQNQSDQ